VKASIEAFLWQVNDGDVQDVSAAVTVTRRNSNRVSNAVTLHTVSSGSFKVANMPSGRAKVVLTRVNGGKKSQAVNSVVVKPRTTKIVPIHLKKVGR
jgi:hypothetical protein